MVQEVTFATYSPMCKKACLGLFDANCPEYFAPNERDEYARFLDTNPEGYELCMAQNTIVGAFGLIGDDPQRRSLNWILLEPKSRGLGLGAAMMGRVAGLARGSGLTVVKIAASHKSAEFFAKFGATTITTTENGWGPGMHRVDMEMRI